MASFPIPPSIIGKAHFPEPGRRRSLERSWGASENDPFALWIGMNPSTAGADEDDPTVQREVKATARLGFQRYVKMNLFDIVATDPRELKKFGLPRLASSTNLVEIAVQAIRAKEVVLAWGAIPKHWYPWAGEVLRSLSSYSLTPLCLGTTKAGHPRHPLYLPADTPFERYEASIYG